MSLDELRHAVDGGPKSLEIGPSSRVEQLTVGLGEKLDPDAHRAKRLTELVRHERGEALQRLVRPYEIRRPLADPPLEIHPHLLELGLRLALLDLPSELLVRARAAAGSARREASAPRATARSPWRRIRGR
jgi:hypothetical protein